MVNNFVNNTFHKLYKQNVPVINFVVANKNRENHAIYTIWKKETYRR